MKKTGNISRGVVCRITVVCFAGTGRHGYPEGAVGNKVAGCRRGV
jgi:hypothetical protein